MESEAIPIPILILASGSPRRRTLLETVGAKFRVCSADCDESAITVSEPSLRVMALARLKCAAVAERYPNDIVLGADTMVCSADGELLGKPRDREDARRMLHALSDSMNIVYTGVCVMRGGEIRCGVERTNVYFRRLSEEEILRYIDSGEPMDKAGAYGVQGRGALFVRRIEGDYFNVVGLPLVLTARLLGEVGYLL